MKTEILTKNEIEKRLKELERKLSNQINQRVNHRLNEKNKEEAKLEKDRLEKQDIKDKKEWSMVKNKEERLLELEQKMSNMGEYLKGVAEQFNNHIDDNNNKFEIISKALSHKE